MTVVLRSKAQLEEFKLKNKKVVVMWSSKSCPACASMKPLVDHVAHYYSAKIAICVVYADEIPSLYKDFPTFEGYYKSKKVFTPVVYDSIKFKKLVTDVINLN